MQIMLWTSERDGKQTPGLPPKLRAILIVCYFLCSALKTGIETSRQTFHSLTTRAMFNFYLLSNWKSNGETSSDIISKWRGRMLTERCAVCDCSRYSFLLSLYLEPLQAIRCVETGRKRHHGNTLQSCIHTRPNRRNVIFC